MNALLWSRVAGIYFLLVGFLAAENYGPFTYVTNGNGVTIVRYFGRQLKHLKIPSKIEGESVVRIGPYAFQGSNIQSILIPDSVVSIGKGAFDNCLRLASIRLPNRLEKIGDYAFYGCNNLLTIQIPPGRIRFGREPFGPNMKRILTKQTNSYFRSVDGVLFDKDLSTLVLFPTGRSGAYAIPSGTRIIGESAFYNCEKVSRILIPSSLEGIRPGSFLGARNLESFEIMEASSSFSVVDSVIFDSSQQELIQYPPGKSGGYTIPPSVKRIGPRAFSGCSVEELTIPEGIHRIERDAFQGFRGFDERLVIPGSVRFIGDYAFLYAFHFRSVIFVGDAPEIGVDVFDGLLDRFTVFYTCGAKGFASPIWKGYKSKAIATDGSLE